MPGWNERVFAVVAQIPSGRVVTYGQIARHLGAPGAARSVGWAMRHCPADLPWYRVVNSKGGISPGGTPWRVLEQRDLLEEDGVSLDLAGRVDLARYGWDGI